MLIGYRERRMEVEREKNIKPNQDWTHNLGICPDWELNARPCSLQDDTPTNRVTPARATLSDFKKKS